MSSASGTGVARPWACPACCWEEHRFCKGRCDVRRDKISISSWLLVPQQIYHSNKCFLICPIEGNSYDHLSLALLALSWAKNYAQALLIPILRVTLSSYPPGTPGWLPMQEPGRSWATT